MVATSVTTPGPGSALPDAVSQSTRIDLRPLGLIAGAADRERPPKERLPGSLAAALAALDQGVHILRVHDVAETRQAVAVWDRLCA